MKAFKTQAAPKPLREQIAHRLADALERESRELVFLCLGSDLITGDSLGPLVGQLLTTKHNLSCFVYGTLNAPVTAKNVVQTAQFISQMHSNACVVAIDAALGEPCAVGEVRVLRRGLYPSAALGKSLPIVGEVGIAAVVGSQGNGILGTRLGFVWRIAEEIAHAVTAVVRERQKVAALAH